MTAIEIVAFSLVGVAALMAMFRLLVGPTNPDRIISADALSLIATVSIILMALAFDSVLYLDIALVYSILSFVGIIALARLIESSKATSKSAAQGED